TSLHLCINCGVSSRSWVAHAVDDARRLNVAFSKDSTLAFSAICGPTIDDHSASTEPTATGSFQLRSAIHFDKMSPNGCGPAERTGLSTLGVRGRFFLRSNCPAMPG